MMTDKQVEMLLNEIKEGHKREIASIFFALREMTIPCSHWGGKTTYKIDMTFSHWRAFEEQYLGKSEEDKATL